MIYYVLYELIFNHFKDKEWYLVKALNVFQYVTFRTAYASITALLLSLLFGGTLIRRLKTWNIGQQIREEGPAGSHGQTRYAHDGRRPDCWFGSYFNIAVGATVERLCVDRGDCHARFWSHWFS